MARAYFCAYYSYLDLLRELTDEEVGRLMRAVFIYAVDGMEIDLPPVERMAFLAISGQIARDTKRYEKICAQRRESALKRFHGEEDDTMPSDNANACKCYEGERE